MPWRDRPPWIGYLHELTHARDAATGTTATGSSPDPAMPAGLTPRQQQLFDTPNSELQATSIGPWAGRTSDENGARDEVGEPPRESYLL